MFNENTLIVGYDKKRGDPRGSRSKQHKHSHLGDCIECQMCVQVCPTGIDIRDGLQYECIGCALCIDACDSVMEKMDYSPGLIRYASEKEFETGTKHQKIDFKTIAYGGILITSMLVFMLLLIQRPLFELSVLRDRGTLYQENGIGLVENYYLLKIINKHEAEQAFSLEVVGIDADLLPEKPLVIASGELKTFPVTIVTDPKNILETSTTIHFKLTSINKPELSITEESKFLGPVNAW